MAKIERMEHKLKKISLVFFRSMKLNADLSRHKEKATLETLSAKLSRRAKNNKILSEKMTLFLEESLYINK